MTTDDDGRQTTDDDDDDNDDDDEYEYEYEYALYMYMYMMVVAAAMLTVLDMACGGVEDEDEKGNERTQCTMMYNGRGGDLKTWFAKKCFQHLRTHSHMFQTR